MFLCRTDFYCYHPVKQGMRKAASQPDGFYAASDASCEKKDRIQVAVQKDKRYGALTCCHPFNLGFRSLQKHQGLHTFILYEDLRRPLQFGTRKWSPFGLKPFVWQLLGESFGHGQQPGSPSASDTNFDLERVFLFKTASWYFFFAKKHLADVAQISQVHADSSTPGADLLSVTLTVDQAQ